MLKLKTHSGFHDLFLKYQPLFLYEGFWLVHMLTCWVKLHISAHTWFLQMSTYRKPDNIIYIFSWLFVSCNIFFINIWWKWILERFFSAVQDFFFSFQLHIWDNGNSQLKQRLRTDGAVLDICAIRTNHTTYLAALTDKILKVFKWCWSLSFILIVC